jgi:hypothetical protein
MNNLMDEFLLGCVTVVNATSEQKVGYVTVGDNDSEIIADWQLSHL